MRGAALLLALLALSACGGDEEHGPGEVPPGELTLRPLVPSMFRCGHDVAENRVLRDATAWAEAWREISAEMAPAPLPPAVDFSREMILAAFLGPGPVGRAVAIQRVERAGDRLIVTVAVRDAGTGAAGGRTGPCSLVAVPRSELTVEWREVGPDGESSTPR